MSEGHWIVNTVIAGKSMDFNMIWISPFYVNQPNGYHGYHILNFNHVDPRFMFGEQKLKDEEKLYLRLLLATDYISGMTDSFAKNLYQEMNGII